MKVLKKGRPQKGWARKFNCTGGGNGGGGCRAQLLVEEGDLFKTHRYSYAHEHDEFTTFKCPECGVLTDIDEVPDSVREKLPETERAWMARNDTNDPSRAPSDQT